MNQHYVSQVLLKRFRRPGQSLQRYSIQTGQWKPKNLEKVFSARGWNQLHCNGRLDDSLEAAFSAVESILPKTFRFLEGTPKGILSNIPEVIHQNLSQYCTFLWLTSPFAKAKAPVDLVAQINLDLQNQRTDMLVELGFDQQTINRFLEARNRGFRAILYSDDFLQLVYRIRFNQSYPEHLGHFLYWTEWTVCDSPIELPLSDVALVQLHLPEDQSVYYVLPLSPTLLLKARHKTGHYSEIIAPQVRREALSTDEAEYWHQAICLSAVTELVATRVIQDILTIRERAWKSGFRFPKIVNPQRGVSSSLSDFNADIGLRMVQTAEYVQYIHSFLKPAEEPATANSAL